jgi:hypothetical protein
MPDRHGDRAGQVFGWRGGRLEFDPEQGEAREAGIHLACMGGSLLASLLVPNSVKKGIPVEFTAIRKEPPAARCRFSIDQPTVAVIDRGRP